MDNSQPLPDDFIQLCQSVTAKRPKAVIDHILEHGFVTTEELKNTYGYNHPPRAARDVREHGIPLDTFRVKQYGCKCFIYLEEVDKRELQIDHRVPFEVDGEPDLSPENFMLLCGSANRAKSWSCEHCENWNSLKDKSICLSCYWAYPENYTHIAMRQIRRIDLMWQGEDIEKYERLKQQAARQNKEIPEFIKEIIELEIDRNNNS